MDKRYKVNLLIDKSERLGYSDKVAMDDVADNDGNIHITELSLIKWNAYVSRYFYQNVMYFPTEIIGSEKHACALIKC